MYIFLNVYLFICIYKFIYIVYIYDFELGQGVKGSEQRPLTLILMVLLMRKLARFLQKRGGRSN